jgi:hypothetical protein
MSRIKKINFTGFALSAAILSVAIATSLVASGCGPAPSVRPATPPVGTNNGAPFVNPGIASNASAGLDPNAAGINDTSGFDAAQINGLIGRYGGNLAAYDQNGEIHETPYTVELQTVQSPSAPGRNFVQATFASGNLGLRSLMRINAIAATWGASGPTYTLTSTVQNASTLNLSGNVLMQLQLTLTSANQFDPAQSPVIHIVDSVFFRDVVGFYNDLQKH